MNHSLLSADRHTHLKIVTVSLIAAIIVVSVGVTAQTIHTEHADVGVNAAGAVLRAGQTWTYTRNETSAVR